MEQFTSISVCPATGDQMSRDDVMSMGGVCPRCGHVSGGTISHEKKIVGTWVYPPRTWWQFRGRALWVPKEISLRRNT